MHSPHLFRSTTSRRESSRLAVRALTVLTATGSVAGAAGVAWALAPAEVSVAAEPAVVTPAVPAAPRPAPPTSLTRTAPAAKPRPAPTRTTVRRTAPAPAVTTSGGS